MSFVKFVVARATVERALSVPLIGDYLTAQGLGDLVEEFAQTHPNYSLADLLDEFGIDVESLPGMVKEFAVNHFGLNREKNVRVVKPESKPNPKLTFE